jgi:hypothetical protein
MRRIAIAAVAAGLLVSGPAVASATQSPIAHIACTRATVKGQSKCIARGQFCAHDARAQRDYHRYGLSCSKRDARGNWHLQ